jgi:hypothetical protein
MNVGTKILFENDCILCSQKSIVTKIDKEQIFILDKNNEPNDYTHSGESLGLEPGTRHIQTEKKNLTII